MAKVMGGEIPVPFVKEAGGSDAGKGRRKRRTISAAGKPKIAAAARARWARVHRDPVIAQFLALVQRWQDDFTRAFNDAERAGKRSRHLQVLAGVPVVPFEKRHASRAARIDAELKTNKIGFADCQIAACAIEERAELLTFNIEHFRRVPGLKLAKV